MNRRTALSVSAAVVTAMLLAACGPGAGKEKGNPAMPEPDAKRASRTNGLGPDGKPIDAVAAAEMKESELPPLKGAPAAPDVAPPPPYKAPAETK